jgi:hypothetical protein
VLGAVGVLPEDCRVPVAVEDLEADRGLEGGLATLASGWSALTANWKISLPLAVPARTASGLSARWYETMQSSKIQASRRPNFSIHLRYLGGLVDVQHQDADVGPGVGSIRVVPAPFPEVGWPALLGPLGRLLASPFRSRSQPTPIQIIGRRVPLEPLGIEVGEVVVG